MDGKTGKLKAFRRRQYITWILIYSLLMTNLIHGLSQFLLLLMFRRDEIVLYHLPAQFDGTIIALMIHPVIITVFCFKRQVLATIFNELYDGGYGSSSPRQLWNPSVQELLAFGAQFIAAGAAILYTLMIIILNDMPHLLMNNPLLQWLKPCTGISILISALLEAWSVSIWILNAEFLLSLSCLVMSKVESDIGKLLNNLRYEMAMWIPLSKFS